MPRAKDKGAGKAKAKPTAKATSKVAASKGKREAEDGGGKAMAPKAKHARVQGSDDLLAEIAAAVAEVQASTEQQLRVLAILREAVEACNEDVVVAACDAVGALIKHGANTAPNTESVKRDAIGQGGGNSTFFGTDAQPTVPTLLGRLFGAKELVGAPAVCKAALKCVAVLTVETFQPNNKRRFYRLVQDGGSFPTDLINAISTHKDDPVVVEQGVLAIEALVNKCPHWSKALREAGVEEVLESAKGVLTKSASEYPDRALAALDNEVPPFHGCKISSYKYKAAVSAARSEEAFLKLNVEQLQKKLRDKGLETKGG